MLGRAQPTARSTYLPVSLHRANDRGRYWNLNQLSITYALRLGLGPDLPWADEPSPGNLRFSAGRILTWFLATYAGRVSSEISSAPYGTPSMTSERSPTTQTLSGRIHNFGTMLEPRWIVGTGFLDQ